MSKANDLYELLDEELLDRLLDVILDENMDKLVRAYIHKHVLAPYKKRLFKKDSRRLLTVEEDAYSDLICVIFERVQRAGFCLGYSVAMKMVGSAFKEGALDELL